MRKYEIQTTLLLSLATTIAFADPIDTDGPNFVASSEVVPAGRFQYEFDIGAYGSSTNGAQQQLTQSPLLLKYGLAENWELRVASNGYSNQGGQEGLGSTSFGFKYRSQSRNLESGVPAIAWIVQFQTPLASPYYRTAGILPSLNVAINWDLPNGFGAGIMPGIAMLADNSGKTYTAGIFGAVLYKSVTEKLRLFAEISIPTISTPNQNGVVTSADVGATYQLTDDTQLGTRFGYGLNSNSPQTYGFFEIAQRF